MPPTSTLFRNSLLGRSLMRAAGVGGLGSAIGMAHGFSSGDNSDEIIRKAIIGGAGGSVLGALPTKYLIPGALSAAGLYGTKSYLDKRKKKKPAISMFRPSTATTPLKGFESYPGEVRPDVW